jgi:RNA polymerase sigma-70 factor (ECF subfamily)
MLLKHSVGPLHIKEDDQLPPEDRVVVLPAIDQLYRTEKPRLLRHLMRRLSAETASDLVQQAFARFVALGAERRARIASPEGYLRRIADNLVFDEIRKGQRHPPENEDELDDRIAEATDHLAGLEARDMLRRLDSAMQALNPRTREIFLAHRIDGYSYAEIARRTGLSVKTVEKHMSRGIAFVDRVLSDR